MERQLDTEEFIIDLFCRIDRALAGVPKRSDASLWPGEIATLGVLFALRGTSERAFDRWLRRQWLMLFPRLPHRTRLFRVEAEPPRPVRRPSRLDRPLPGPAQLLWHRRQLRH